MFRIAFLALFLATHAVAQDWPARQIRIIVPFAPGGIADTRPVGNTPDEYTAQIRADLAQWGPIVKRAGVRIE
jgi:tripartite-type tricarboxylate transporter receptor subunit TctC